jgi:hypothetical protein
VDVPSSSSSEGEPDGSLSTSSGTSEGPTDAGLPTDRDNDADAFVAAEPSFASEGVPEVQVQALQDTDETAFDDPGPVRDEVYLEAEPEPGIEAGPSEAFDMAIESHFEPISDSTPAPVEGESEPWAGSTHGETNVVDPGPARDEVYLEAEPEPEDAVGSSEAIDEALALPQHAPPYVSDPVDFFTSISGIGEQATDAPSPDKSIEAEAVATAEGSFASGEVSEVMDEAASGESTADERAWTEGGGNPQLAYEPDFAVESAEVVVLEPDPDALPQQAGEAGYVASDEVEIEAQAAEETARDAGNRALEEVAEEIVTDVFLGADQGRDATSEDDQDRVEDVARDNGIAPDAFADMTRDNGIAPDASVDIPPVEIANEDALSQPRDRVEDTDATAASSDRPNRSSIGKFPSFARGLRPRIKPATRWRPGQVEAFPRRVVRSSRGQRVSPALRLPSRWVPGRSRTACRTFPPRSPPAFTRRL